MYFSLSFAAQSNVMMYLPEEQSHSRADSPVANVEQQGGTSYVDEAIEFDDEALEEDEQLHSRADSPIANFQQGGRTSFIDEAIELDGEALEEVEQLHSRAEALFAKSEEGEGTRHMNEAIELDRQRQHFQGRARGEYASTETAWSRKIAPIGTDIIR
ncbi:hypothetical protein OG21DRAFT_1482447 [Imleria badia]|nr:hypothetical protein OG21DRAFT_1482447 [Imleria badia]